MTALGLQPFLTYPAVIKLRHKGEQRSFDSPQKAEDFISSLSQKKTYTVAPQGNGRTAATISSARREGLDGRDGGDSCCPGEDGGRVDVDTCWIFFFSFLSPPGMLFLFARRNCLFTGETNSPLFFRRGLVESGLDCSVLFWLCGPLGGSSCIGVDRSWIINILVAQSDLRS